MSEKIRVYCEEEKKYETLIDLIISAAYYKKKIDIKERLDGFKFVWHMYCPKVYQDYLKERYDKVHIEHIGI